MTTRVPIVIRGRIERVDERTKAVRIYVYADEGGRELSNYIGCEVEGIVIVKA